MKQKKWIISFSFVAIMVAVLCSATASAATAKPAAPRIVQTQSSTAGNILVRWSKVSNASGYQVWRSSSETGKYQRIKTVTNAKQVKYTNKNLSGKVYYYKVRAYATSGKSRVYSSFSAAKKQKVKKVNITTEYLGSQNASTISKFSALKKSIGGMHKQSSSNYPAFFATGSKMTIGVNFSPVVSKKKTQHYVYIKNTGNASVGILDVYPKMSFSKAVSTLKSQHLYQSSTKNTVFYWGDAGTVKLTVKDNIVIGYSYHCTPTSE